MKQLILAGLVMGVAAMNVQAEECFDMDIGFPCENEAVYVAEQAPQVVSDAKKANKKLRLNFVSRRPYLNNQKNQAGYLASDEWVGATYQSDKQLGVTTQKKSNINMFSRRPYRAGQPD